MQLIEYINLLFKVDYRLWSLNQTLYQDILNKYTFMQFKKPYRKLSKEEHLILAPLKKELKTLFINLQGQTDEVYRKYLILECDWIPNDFVGVLLNPSIPAVAAPPEGFFEDLWNKLSSSYPQLKTNSPAVLTALKRTYFRKDFVVNGKNHPELKELIRSLKLEIEEAEARRVFFELTRLEKTSQQITLN